MANIVKLKRSSVQGKIPTTSALELGEVALNTFDGNLFFKKDDGTESIVQVSTLDGSQSLTNKTIDGEDNTILLKRSDTTGVAPTSGDIEYGELYLNYADGKIYYRTDTDDIDSFSVGSGGGEGGDTFRTIAVSGQSSVIADSSTDTLTLVEGDGITITTDQANDSITITNSAAVKMEVDTRLGTTEVKLSGMLQAYLGYDDTLTRTALAFPRSRDGSLYQVTA